MIIIKSKFGVLQFRPSLFVLGHFFLLGVGIGFDMKWVGVSRISGPTIAPQNPTVRLPGRRGGFWCPQGLLSWLVKSGPPWVPRPFRLPKARFCRFGTRGVLSLILFMDRRGSLRYARRAFIGAFMKQRGSSGWGFPSKLGGIYVACNSPFGFREN